MDFRNFIFKRKIKLVQLADIIINDMHITRNDIVIVHISLSHFDLIDSTAEDLLYFLKMVVGIGGTLLVPETIQTGNSSESFAVWSVMAATISEDDIKTRDEKVKTTMLDRPDLLKAKIIGIGVPATDYPDLHEVKIFEKHGIPFFLANMERT